MAANDTTKTTTKPAARKPATRKPAARKPAARKPAAKRTTTRSASARTTTSAKATSARRSATRQSDTAAREATAAARSAEKAADSTVDLVAVYAEKALLIQVGAALTVRDTVAATVTDVREFFASTSVDQQLKRFEKRGTTARRNAERGVKKARTKAERELRTRRRDVERVTAPVRSFGSDLESSAASLREDVTALGKDVATQTTRVTGSAQRAAQDVSKRVVALA